MCRCGKCFVSFVLALLLSSVSLVPCFASASEIPDFALVELYSGYYADGYVNPLSVSAGVDVLPNDYDNVWYSDFFVKSLGVTYSGVDTAMRKTPIQVTYGTDNVAHFDGVVGFEYPKNGKIGFVFSGGLANSFGRFAVSGTDPTFLLSICENGTTWSYASDIGDFEYSYTSYPAYQMYGDIYNEYYYAKKGFTNLGDWKLSQTYQVSGSYTPADLNSVYAGFSFSLRNCYWSPTPSTSAEWETPYLIYSAVWHVGDDSLFDVVSQILTHTASIDGNLTEMVEIINGMYTELQAIGADTKTMVELLTSIDSVLSTDVMDKLTSIDDTSKQIYELLYNSLSDESEELTGAAQDAADRVAMNSNTEQYFQDEMSGTFNELQLQGFTFGTVLGGVELVGNIFSSMWSAWGEYVIIFTFPLFMGVALLVIGRIDKTGGGNSSRNSEHKGGEGGA